LKTGACLPRIELIFSFNRSSGYVIYVDNCIVIKQFIVNGAFSSRA